MYSVFDLLIQRSHATSKYSQRKYYVKHKNRPHELAFLGRLLFKDIGEIKSTLEKLKRCKNFEMKI